MESEPRIAVVTKEGGGDFPCSYVIRIYEGWGFRCGYNDEDYDKDKAVAAYDSNTMHLRAATEFLAMAIRQHAVEVEDVYFDDGSYDLELSWRSYAELR